MSEVDGQTNVVKRKRRPIACERCNARRVKCDAFILGPPCTNCKASNRDNCRLINSKRSRGAAGKFVAQNPKEIHALQQSVEMPNQQQTARTRTTSSTTARHPDFVLNLTELCRIESNNDEPVLQINTTESSESSPTSIRVGGDQAGSPTEHKSPGDRISYLGESWYLSYIFQNTNNEFNQLHRSVEQAGDQAGTSPGETGPGNTETVFPDRKQMPIDLPTSHLQDDLVEAYFSRFHLYCPIIEQSPFLASIKNGSVSITLLRCVLFIASVHCDMSVLSRLGYNSRLDAVDDFFGKASTSFDNDTDFDRLTMLVCSYLLHYWWGRPTNYKDSLWRLAGVIRSAQCMGMHRNTLGSRMAPEVKSRWKRIWWILYIRDRQTSLSVGTPMIINDIDCDVEELTMDDFSDDSEETALYTMTQASLSCAAGEIFHSNFSPSRRRRAAESRYKIEARQQIQAKLTAWHTSVPDIMRYETGGKGHLALVLQMTYKLYTILFYQQLQRASSRREIGSEDSSVILEAASTITRLVEDAMIHWNAQYFPMICVTAIFATMTAQYVESFSPDAYKNQILSHKLRSNLLGLVKFEQVYVLARWIRSLFASILEAPMDFPGSKVNPSNQATRPNQVKQLDGLRTNFRRTTTAGKLVYEPSPNGEFQETRASSSGPYGLLPFPSATHVVDETLLGGSEAPSYCVTIPSTAADTVQYVHPAEASRDVLMPSAPLSPMQWPSPSSFQFQNFNFLADLGFAGFDDSLWDASHQYVDGR